MLLATHRNTANRKTIKEQEKEGKEGSACVNYSNSHLIINNMTELLILSKQDVTSNFSMDEAISAMEKLFKCKYEVLKAYLILIVK